MADVTRKHERENSEERIQHPFKRVFAHVDGNWPTFVYIPIITSNSSKGLRRIFDSCLQHYLDHNTSTDTDMKDTKNLITESNFHISLSKTFTLRFHQISPFIGLLVKALQSKIK